MLQDAKSLTLANCLTSKEPGKRIELLDTNIWPLFSVGKTEQGHISLTVGQLYLFRNIRKTCRQRTCSKLISTFTYFQDIKLIAQYFSGWDWGCLLTSIMILQICIIIRVAWFSSLSLRLCTVYKICVRRWISLDGDFSWNKSFFRLHTSKNYCTKLLWKEMLAMVPDLCARNATNSNFWYADSGLRKIFHGPFLLPTPLNLEKGKIVLYWNSIKWSKEWTWRGSLLLYNTFSFSSRANEGAIRIKAAWSDAFILLYTRIAI